MTAVNQDIGISPQSPFMSGDTRTLNVPVKDQDGAVFDLTNLSAARWELFTANGRAFFGSAVVAKSLGSGIEATDAAAGVLQIALLPADTAALAGDFYHEAEIVMAGGAVHTVLTGRFKITWDAIE